MKENQPLGPPPAHGERGPSDVTAAGEPPLPQLEAALDLLAQRYAQLPAQPEAEQKAVEALKPFTRALSDDELDWLAAAGPGGTDALTSPAGSDKDKEK